MRACVWEGRQGQQGAGGHVPADHKVRAVCVLLCRARVVVIEAHNCLERRSYHADICLVLDDVGGGSHPHLDVLHPLAAAEESSES